MRRLVAFASDRRGVAAMLVALCLGALMASAAVSIDLGDIFMRSRQLQGVADLAAMAAAQSLDPSAASTPQASAEATAGLNPWTGGAIAVQTVTGAYAADPTIPSSQRFVAGGVSPNAVQVTLSAPVPLYFAGLLIGRSSLNISRTATAAHEEYAAFSIGSGLASLNGGVANALLSALTGSTVSLSVMNYQALASANVDLLSYLPALQTRAGIQAASFDQLLAANIAPSTQLAALSDVLGASGQAQAASAATQLSTASVGLPAQPLSALLDLGPFAQQDHSVSVGASSLSVNALALTDVLLSLANGSRQLALNLDGQVPGVAGLKVWLAIGQRPSHSPWLTVTDTGQVIVRTAQMRLYLQATVLPSGLGLLGGGGALVTLPVYVEMASAQARLQDITCPADPASQSFDLQVSPSLGALAIGQANVSTLGDFTTPEALSPAVLLNAPLLRVTAFSQVQVGGGQASWQTVRFTQADVASDAMKSVFTNDIARASLASLLTSTTLQVQLAGLGVGLGLGPVTSALQGVLTPVAAPLDTVIGQVESITGVRLGEGDVWANGLRCRGAALVG